MRLLRLPYTDQKQFYARMVFNALARNYSDHTGNISFLMGKDGQWQLAPAYDLTYSWQPDNRFTRGHQLSINTKREDITREDLLQVAKAMNIKKPSHILEEIQESMGRWPEYADMAKMPSAQMSVIRKNFIQL